MSDTSRQVVLDAVGLGERIDRAFYDSDARPPGEVLAAWLEDSRTTQTELATLSMISRDTISMLINGRRAFTPLTARRLQEVTGIPALVWLVLQSERDLGNL